MATTKKAFATVLVGLFAAAFGMLLLASLSSCGPKQVEVPDLAYQSSAEAEKALTSAGLKLGTVTEKEDAEVKLGDLVIEQSAEAGSKINEGTAVDIVVTKGPKMGDPVTVPDLTGKTVEEAEAALAELLLIPIPGEPQNSDTVESGKICAQSIKPGSEAKVLDDVTYSVSIGKEKVAVPDVVGKTLADARAELEKVGLGVDTTTAYDDKVAKDSVISQSVKKDEQVDKGSVVTLTISLGVKPPDQVTVPSIISFNLTAAKSTLDSAGLKYTYTGDESGAVAKQDPAPGTKVDQGTTVTFELKQAKKTSSGKSSSKNSKSKAKKSSGSNTISDSDARTLNMLDLDEIVWQYGLGELANSSIVQLDNGKWYVEIETKGVDGDLFYFYIGTDDEVYIIGENGKLEKI